MYNYSLIDYARLGNYLKSRRLFYHASALAIVLVDLAKFQSHGRVIQARLNPYKYLMNLPINQIDDRSSTLE